MLDIFGSMLSQILGGGAAAGAGAGAGGAIFGQMTPSATGGVNPFGAISNMVGGPASQQGTLFSLPGEMLKGVENLAVSDNIIGDTMNLAKPITNLASGTLGDLGLGDLSMLNPFGSGQPTSSFSAALQALLPVGLMTGLSAAADARNKKRYGRSAV